MQRLVQRSVARQTAGGGCKDVWRGWGEGEEVGEEGGRGYVPGSREVEGDVKYDEFGGGGGNQAQGVWGGQREGSHSTGTQHMGWQQHKPYNINPLPGSRFLLASLGSI